MKKIITRVIITLAVLILLLSTLTIIPTGYTGVKTTFGQISNKVLTAGLHIKIPFVQGIQKVNNKQQDAFYAQKNIKVWGETQEKVPVYMADITVTYQISPEKSSWIYANVSDYKSALISDSIVASALKEASATIVAEKVTNRGIIEPSAQEMLQNAVDGKYGENTVYIIKVVINDMDFEDSYNQAISNRSLASMNKETQAIENATAIAKAEANAEVSIRNAQANADAAIIKAQGEADAMLKMAAAQAEANEKLAESLSSDIIEYEKINRWNGVLPTVSGGNAIVSIGVE